MRDLIQGWFVVKKKLLLGKKISGQLTSLLSHPAVIDLPKNIIIIIIAIIITILCDIIIPTFDTTIINIISHIIVIIITTSH